MSARKTFGTIATAIMLLLAIVPPAHAGPSWSVVMFSDGGDRQDWIGLGQQRRFDASNATLEIKGGPQSLWMRVDSPATNEYYDFELEPPGGVLTEGVHEPGGLNVGGSGRGCNGNETRTQIFDLAFSPAGALQRLWMTYEQHCDGRPQALFGEVRFGQPPSQTTPDIVRWPPSDVGHVDTAVPVLVQPGAQVASVSITGGGASQFEITSDGCTGRTLTGSAGCTVSVRHRPTSPGTHLASLHVVKAGGGAVDAALQAIAFGGVTRFTYASEQSDYAGGGLSRTYTPAEVDMWPLWTLDHVRVFIDRSSWRAEFAAPRGEAFLPGTYLGALRWPFNDPAPGLSVTGSSGCNRITGQFHVKEIAFDAFGRIARFGASFEQHCEGAPPALRGDVDFRLGDTTAPAPWMRIGPITSVSGRNRGAAGLGAAGQPAGSVGKALRLLRARRGRAGGIKIAVRVNRPGILTARATFGRSRARLYGRANRKVKKAGTVRLTVRPRRAARRALRKAKRLRVRVQAQVEEPTGAVTRAAPQRVLVRLP